MIRDTQFKMTTEKLWFVIDPNKNTGKDVGSVRAENYQQAIERAKIFYNIQEVEILGPDRYGPNSLYGTDQWK